jgi:sarcosine oxidase gamma subunit
MVPFGGWEMPVEYSSITGEHMAVRTRAGVFDVSHMGEIEIAGKDALAAVQRISSNDASRLHVGQAQYSALTTFEGTFIDDILVYRMAPNHFMLVVNASNIDKDYAWIAAQVRDAGEAAAVDSSSRYALIAVHGRFVSDQVLLVHARGGRECTSGDLAHRVHGRGWIRDLRPSGDRRSRLAGNSGVRTLGRGRSMRARCPRHAPARGRHAAVWQ